MHRAKNEFYKLIKISIIFVTASKSEFRVPLKDIYSVYTELTLLSCHDTSDIKLCGNNASIDDVLPKILIMA